MDINKLYKICKDRGYKGSKEDLIKTVKMEEKDLMSVCGGTKGINSRRITAGILTLLGLTSSYPVDKVGAEETSRFKTVKNFVKEHPIATGIEGIGLAGTTVGIATAIILAARNRSTWAIYKVLDVDSANQLVCMIKEISTCISNKKPDYENLIDKLLEYNKSSFEDKQSAYNAFISMGGNKLINALEELKLCASMKLSTSSESSVRHEQNLSKEFLEICNETLKRCRLLSNFDSIFDSILIQILECAENLKINSNILTPEEMYLYAYASDYFKAYREFNELSKKIMEKIKDEKQLEKFYLPFYRQKFQDCRSKEELKNLKKDVQETRNDFEKNYP